MMLDERTPLENMAFASMKPADQVATIAACFGKTYAILHDPSEDRDLRARIDDYVAKLIKIFGGKLAGMTRKNLVSAVMSAVDKRARREYRKAHRW